MRNVAKKKSASKRGWHPIEKAWFDVLYKEFVSVASGQNSNWPAYGTLQGFLNENTRSDEERKNAEWRCAQATTQIKSLMKEALEAYYGDMPLPEEIVW